MFKKLFERPEPLPNFWKDYLALFKGRKKLSIRATRFVAFDTETTGFDKKEDRILSIGAVTIQGTRIAVSDTLELYLEQAVFKPETVKIHGLLKEGSLEKVTELKAIELFLSYIGDAVLVAHHASFDKGMINDMLLRHHLGKLKNKCIDTGILYKTSKHAIYQQGPERYSLDELAEHLDIPMTDRHTATGDALITALAFLKILSRLDRIRPLKWRHLFGR